MPTPGAEHPGIGDHPLREPCCLSRAARLPDRARRKPAWGSGVSPAALRRGKAAGLTWTGWPATAPPDPVPTAATGTQPVNPSRGRRMLSVRPRGPAWPPLAGGRQIAAGASAPNVAVLIPADRAARRSPGDDPSSGPFRTACCRSCTPGTRSHRLPPGICWGPPRHSRQVRTAFSRPIRRSSSVLRRMQGSTF